MLASLSALTAPACRGETMGSDRRRDVITLRPDDMRRAGQLIAISDLEAPLLRAAFAFCEQLRGQRRFLDRREISPRLFKPYLRNLALIRVEDEGRDYEFRIVGDAFHVLHGFSAQGLRIEGVDRISPGYGSASRRIFDRVRKLGSAIALRGQMERPDADGSIILQESLYLPLGPGTTTIDHILCFACFDVRSVVDP